MFHESRKIRDELSQLRELRDRCNGLLDLAYLPPVDYEVFDDTI